MTEDKGPGHGNPPKRYRFKPGKSGNPRGRPKGSRNIRTDLTELMKRKVAVRENGRQRRISRQEAMLLSLYDKALRGDVRAATSIINMMLELEPAARAEVAHERTLSETDKEILADFLRRHYQLLTP
jgi:hypothetical protein